ncbi:MAG: Ryanodine receptor Ryr [Bacteroidales bacterium]|nr:Ryanodine receptor Ryr [Bacteroidales bacterium]
MKTYTPNPINTSDVVLPKELEQLTEEMAKNVHELWSQTRIEQGWKYGEKRDDENKLHPCLIAYEDLPDSEKVYDRNSAIETLKLILKLGFKITK